MDNGTVSQQHIQHKMLADNIHEVFTIVDAVLLAEYKTLKIVAH